MQPNDIDFLIIGATKSATTWLQKSLQSVSGVVMPDPEPHYFSRHYDNGPQWYFSQFPDTDGARLVGEKSNSYLDDPAAARRVYTMLPHAKLIMQLRNPVERAYSDYCMLYRRGEVDGRIEDYLTAERASFRRFLENGLYHEQVAAYAALYPTEQILILFYEDMVNDPDEQLRRVGSFLGIADLKVPPVREAVKDRTEPMVGPRLRRALRPIKPLVAPLRRFALFQAMRQRMIDEIRYPPLTSRLRAGLEDFYKNDVTNLGNFLGRDLSGWLYTTRRPTSFD
jgi:hypothetical protein